jgi:hypothetical protein
MGALTCLLVATGKQKKSENAEGHSIGRQNKPISSRKIRFLKTKDGKWGLSDGVATAWLPPDRRSRKRCVLALLQVLHSFHGD